MPVLTLPAILDHRAASACAAQLSAAVRGVEGAAGEPANARAIAAAGSGSGSGSGSGAGVVLDASALHQFDSSAIAVMLACRRDALSAGHSFAVKGMAPRLQSLVSLYGVSELLNGTPATTP